MFSFNIEMMATQIWLETLKRLNVRLYRQNPSRFVARNFPTEAWIRVFKVFTFSLETVKREFFQAVLEIDQYIRHGSRYEIGLRSMFRD